MDGLSVRLQWSVSLRMCAALFRRYMMEEVSLEWNSEILAVLVSCNSLNLTMSLSSCSL